MATFYQNVRTLSGNSVVVTRKAIENGVEQSAKSSLTVKKHSTSGDLQNPRGNLSLENSHTKNSVKSASCKYSATPFPPVTHFALTLDKAAKRIQCQARVLAIHSAVGNDGGCGDSGCVVVNRSWLVWMNQDTTHSGQLLMVHAPRKKWGEIRGWAIAICGASMHLTNCAD